MLYEHEITKNLEDSIAKSTKNYISSGDHIGLVKDIDEYIHHVSLIYQKKTKKFLLWLI
jgi:hypothetical protein